MDLATRQEPFLNIPETISTEAQAFLGTLRDPALTPPFPDPDDLSGWKELHDFVETDATAQSDAIVKRYAPIVTERSLAGVGVLDLRPMGWRDNGKVALYTHGGAHTLYSAASTLGTAAMFADDTGLRVISVDYTVAPAAKFQQITDEVISAVEALLQEGYRPRDLLFYGDSSGGGLAAACILKMRDQGLSLPTAAVLVSPWVDLTPAGDTEFTLRHA